MDYYSEVKKEWPIDTDDSIDESQNNYDGGKKHEQKILCMNKFI